MALAAPGAKRNANETGEAGEDDLGQRIAVGRPEGAAGARGRQLKTAVKGQDKQADAEHPPFAAMALHGAGFGVR